MREYSTREVAAITSVPARRIRHWASTGLLTPQKDARGHWRYSFQDLALVRTAKKLLDHGISLNRVGRTLRQLREQVPRGRPLSAVRIVVVGERVIVSDRLSSWEPDLRQGTLDFDVHSLIPRAPRRIRLKSQRPSDPPEKDAGSFYQQGLDLELAGREDEALHAYEAALKRDPRLALARINLGRLLHAAGRLAEAEAMYRAALKEEPGNVLAMFNLGVALDDQGQTDTAIDVYRRVLALDDAYADAHFNLSRLYEEKGDKRAALRHLASFRRLMKSGA